MKTLAQPMNFMQKLFELSFWQGMALSLYSLLSGFFWPIAPFVGIALVLVVLDYITGTRAAKRRGAMLTSRGHYRSVEKFVMYSIAIFAAELFHIVFFKGIYLVENISPTYFIALLIARTEFRSNIENIETITGARIWKTFSGKFSMFKTDSK